MNQSGHMGVNIGYIPQFKKAKREHVQTNHWVHMGTLYSDKPTSLFLHQIEVIWASPINYRDSGQIAGFKA